MKTYTKIKGTVNRVFSTQEVSLFFTTSSKGSQYGLHFAESRIAPELPKLMKLGSHCDTPLAGTARLARAYHCLTDNFITIMIDANFNSHQKCVINIIC
jgi:hypothetical protein